MKKTMMMWFSMLLLAMVGTMSASAQELSIADFDIQAGGTKVVAITLTSETPVYGIQADVVASEGLAISKAEAVAEGLHFDSNVVKSGATRVAQLSLSGAAIAAGDVINLTIAADAEFAGNGSIQLKNIELTTSKDGMSTLSIEEGQTATVTKAEAPAVNTYTATFTTNKGWENVYAYAWSGEGEATVEFLGDWPGTKLEAVDVVYTVTIETTEAAPEKIIFNNGVDEQTEDLDFEDGKAYEFNNEVPPVQNTYTVAGSSEDLFGISWDVTATANDMVLNAETGLYEWSKADVTLEAGVIQFKVAVNHAWTEAYPESDYVLNIAEAGTYDVVITFNAESKEVNATATKKGGEQPVLNTYTATFTTNTGWTKVCAYAWSGEGQEVVEFLGEWPGTEIFKNAETGLYELSFVADEAPAYIIFNNGLKGEFEEKTEDLAFEDGKAYEYMIEVGDLLAEAKELALDADAVAVGKLLAAIEVAEGGDQSGLLAAINQFKADNADNEKDETAKVGVEASAWTGASGLVGWAAPEITTYDGRTTALAEKYESTVATTGTLIYQDITGLTNGQYKVGFYANAFFTEGRGFTSDIVDGQEDVAYVFANEQKAFIPAHIAVSTTENSFRTFDVEVTDGQIRLGLGKEKAGTNWHTIQIYQLTWFTTAKEVYAEVQEELAALVVEAKALAADEYKTVGKEDFNAVLAIAEEATLAKKNWYNVSEAEEILANLRTAIANFKKANWFIDFAAGEYYIVEAQTGMMMAAGNDWGTRGIINESGLNLTLTPYEESRTVTIDSRVSNGGNNHFLSSNLYMDSSEWGWALEYQGFGFYILEPVSGKYINVSTTNNNLELSDTPLEWIIVSKEGVIAQHMGEMAEATENNPVDATFLLQDPNFNRNDQRVEAWTISDDCTNYNISRSDNNQANYCGESYRSTFTIMQTVSGAPAGLYKLTAQGFYRQDAYEGDEPAAPVFFANGKNQDVPVKTGEENDLSAAAASFAAGLYTIEPITFVVKEDGMMYVGVTASTNTQWVAFDNFQLTYYGPYSQKGDANMDAEVTAGDAVLVVNVALEKETLTDEQFALADINNSQTITVADAVGIVNIAIDAVETSVEARAFGGNDFLTLNGQQLSLNNTTSFVAFQMDVTLANGASFNGVELSQRANGLQVATNKIGDNTWRIVAFSLNNTKITGNEGNLLRINANGEININNVEFVDAAANAYALGFGDATGISEIETVKTENAYNLGGQKVQKTQKGLYIINGKKMVVK